MTNQSLRGKSAFVTGGAKRIGREISLSLAKAGADVTITYRSSKAEAGKTVKAIEKLGRRALAVECDVRSEASVSKAIDASVAFHKRLDVLVNNAAVFESGQLEEISVAQWNAVFETNTLGPFLVSRAALPHLRSAHGRIIHIGSLGGLRAWSGHAHYCSSKAALHMLTQTMAKAFAPDVTVNCVAPGWIEMDGDKGDVARRFAQKTPLRRNGTAEDVAQAVLFFAAGPGFVTGQILAVDGGLGL
jgi:NAD(P)-dependent dehydrogenase (short-subunit alcohol dehydrogenase family)